MYACARIRAMENHIAGKDVIEQLLYAPGVSDMALIMRNFGAGQYMKNEGATLDSALSDMTDGMYSELERIVPDVSLLNVFRCKYDCNNVKTAIKCEGRDLDTDSMLYSCGMLSKEQIYNAVKTNDFSALPENMAQAAKEASETFRASGNPQIVDILLDKACYLDMLNFSSSDKTVHRWIKVRTDITNLLITLRIIGLKVGEGGISLLRLSLLDGGYISKKTFEDGYYGGEEKLFSCLEYGRLSGLIKNIKPSGKKLSFAVAEREADNFFMDMVKEAKFIPFGGAVPAAYITAHEYAIKNIRIILAGKDANMSAELIRERLRESYV